jgi:hypothetical protein
MKKHTIDELKSIYIWFKGDDVGFVYFKDKYDEEIQKGSPIDDIFFKTVEDETIYDIVVDYLKRLLRFLREGHSIIYADKIARDDEDDEENRSVYEAFSKVFEIDPLLAKNELILYCRTKGWTDPIQVNFFIHMMEEGEYFNLGKYSKNYYDAYLSKIKIGKSELYAHVYADNSMIDEYNECYCDAYAWAFEKAVNAKKSKDIILEYCESFADEISNITDSFDDAVEDQEFFNFYHNQAIAKIQAIEYAKKNNINNLNDFIKSYVNKFMNNSDINRNYHDISD